MKKLVLMSLFWGWVLSCAPTFVAAQEFKTNVKKEFAVEKNGAGSVLAVFNIQGPIKVEGYAGDKVLIEVNQTISAKQQDQLEAGKKEFRLVFEQKEDSIMVYIAAPFDSRPNRNRRRGEQDKKEAYQFDLDFVIKVPMEMSLDLMTINQGDINVAKVTGALTIRNVNGAITLHEVKGITNASTVNGNITADYLKTPSGASSYTTINGQIKVICPANFSADLRMKSMSGAFYTDFESTVLPVEVNKVTEKEAQGALYKLNKNSDIRIGSGGSLFKFETLSGDIILKKQS